MTDRNFVHLHTHTEFSLLDGSSRITPPKHDADMPTLFTRAAQLKMPALAMTDHGVMFGALDFYKAGREAGVKPILGVEAYVAPGSRFERTKGESEERYRHLTILATNEVGYRNLLKLVTDGYLEGFYTRPRIDKELLAEHAEGLIGLSGCLGGEVQQLLLAGQRERAVEVAGQYGDIFGAGNFFLEMQDHGIPDQRTVNPLMLELAAATTLPLVATNDLHYTSQEDAQSHDILLCIQQSKQQVDTDRLKFDGDGFYLKSSQEMREVFRELPEACDNTLAIAERIEHIPQLEGALVDGNIDFHVPRFEPPDGLPLEDHLRALVYEGAVERYGEVTDAIRERIDHELEVICSMGFAGYFLIVWDLIRFSRESGIRVGPGRGSAAGSVVSYSLRITDLDPLRYGLIFERFLNPERVQMPDIDMDFDDRRRDEVIKYVGRKYGEDHVAQIVTFQTIKGKQGIRDAARVLGFPASMGDRLCKMYPPAQMGRDEPIERALELSPELKEAYEKEVEASEIIDAARALEGLRREDSVHAAGVVIGDAPLVNYLPLKLAKDSRDDSRRIVTQFDMAGVEALGLLKMDFLGLRTLSVIEDTLANLRRRGIELDIDHIPLDDAPTFQMLCAADTTGVFQMESQGMRELIKVLAPDRFEDLMALVALYRPGPLNTGMHIEYAERKHGRRKVAYPHDDLKPILEGTYGVMVYQEQIMQTAVTLAGFSMGESDTLRKAMGKKKLEVLMPFKEKFIAGATDRGYDAKMAASLFEMIVPFADYGFNASHACAYAYVAYQTAFLKAHHPVEFMAAVLTSVKDDKDKKPFYLYACRSMQIEVLPPDVNDSDVNFSPTTDGEPKIRYGLSAVRNVGEGAVLQIIAARQKEGAFTSFPDFCRKVDASVLTKRVMESLTLAGAFDSMGYERRALFENFDKVSAPLIAQRKAEAAGQFSLFGSGEDDGEGNGGLEVDEKVLRGEEFDKRDLLRMEKDMLGQYVTDHPLLEVREQLLAQTDTRMTDLADRGDGDLVTVGGIIQSVARRYTKKNEPYALFRVEDLMGGVGVMAFPNIYEKAPELIQTDEIVIVTGRVDLRGRELQLRAIDVKPMKTGGASSAPPARASGPVVVEVPAASCTSGMLAQLKEVLSTSPGQTPVIMRLVGDQGITPLRLGDEYRVDPTGGLLSELRVLLGPNAVRVEEPFDQAS